MTLILYITRHFHQFNEKKKGFLCYLLAYRHVTDSSMICL